jgi:small-conductance mechanosensitive channel
VTFQQVLEYYGDSRAAEASTTAVRNYESKYKIKDGKSTEGVDAPANKHQDIVDNDANKGGGDDNDKIPAWAQALIDGQKAVNDRISAFEKGRTTESRRSRLDAVLSKLPETLRKAYSRTPVETQSDEEFTALLADVTNEVSEIERSARASGAVIGRPLNSVKTTIASGGNTPNAVEPTDAEVDAVVAKLNI